MKIKKIKDPRFKLLTDNIRDIKTPDWMPQLPTILVASGKRNSGKSQNVRFLIDQYQKAGSIQRTFALTPTYLSNKALIDSIVDEDDVYEPHDGALKEIREKLDEEAEEYEDFFKKKEMYERLMEQIKNNYDLDDNLLLEFFDNITGVLRRPEPKYGTYDRPIKPHFAILCDDLQGTKLLSSKRAGDNLAKFAIAHRHIPSLKKGGNLGTSLFFCIQNYRTLNGLPKSVRGNCCVLLLWKTGSNKELEAVIEEVEGEVPKESFLEKYNYAVKEPHNYLMIDFHPKSHHPSMLRHNHDEFLE
jgi:hypothetical protein